MRKSDLNSSMLFKLRGGERLCVLLERYLGGEQALYDKGDLLLGRYGGSSSLNKYKNDLSDIDGCSDFDIVAIKQMDSTFEAIHAVLKNKEPLSWDWQSEEVQEMTLAEIEKALGHRVKVVKENG